MALINDILALVEGVRASREVGRRADSNDSAHFARSPASHLARHFQYQIPAHRKAHSKNLRQLVSFNQFRDDRAHIAAQPGVVQSGRQMICSATIALIHANDIKSFTKRLLRYPAHISGLARAFEAMKQDNRRVPARLSLPMALRENACARFRLEFARLSGRQQRKAAPPERTGHGHQMRISKQEGRLELFHT